MPPPTTPNPIVETIKAIEPVVGWVLVIAGWYLVRRDNNQREDRHEIRAVLDTIIKEIKDLELLAYKYYQSAASDSTALVDQVTIKRDQTAMEARVNRLSEQTRRFANQDKLSKFRMDLTGGDFEQKDRPPRPVTDGKLLQISHSSMELINYLEAEYTSLFPNKSAKKKKP